MKDISDISPRDQILRIVEQLLTVQSMKRPIRIDDNLRDFGLTSMDMANMVLKVESACQVAIPDDAITPGNFRSIATIESLVSGLRQS